MKQMLRPTFAPGVGRSLFFCAFALAGFTSIDPAHAADAALGRSLPELLNYAREHNPELASRRFEADAARERIEPASALPDPRFEIELMDITNTMSGGGTSLVPGDVGQTRYRLVQPIPFYGKRGTRGALAEAQAGQVASQIDVTALQIEARIKTAFVRYYQAVGQTAIFRETLNLVEGLGRLVETRYSVGLVPQQDVVRAHSEATALKVDLIDTERRRRDAAAKLNAQLPRSADAPLLAPERLPELRRGLQLSTVFEQAKSNSPELARERLGVDAAGKGKELAYLNRYPDFAVGVTNNRPQNGKDNWDVMVGFTIPLQQSSLRAQEREAERRVDSARSQVEAAEARLNGRLGETLSALESSDEKARLLADTLLPQSRANLKAAQAGYESGQVNFNTLIDAERQVLSTRLSLLDAEVESRVQQTELELLIGAPL